MSPAIKTLAEAIRDHRPVNADAGAKMMWYALIGAAGAALFGDDETARARFLSLCQPTEH